MSLTLADVDGSSFVGLIIAQLIGILQMPQKLLLVTAFLRGRILVAVSVANLRFA